MGPGIGPPMRWHQDYGYWYKNQFLFPDQMLSVMVAFNRATVENGCLQVIKGSHKLGRVEHGFAGEQVGASQTMVDNCFKLGMELVYAELEPGDALFFHANTLHRSEANTSDKPRWSFISAYNRSGGPAPIERAVQREVDVVHHAHLGRAGCGPARRRRRGVDDQRFPEQGSRRYASVEPKTIMPALLRFIRFVWVGLLLIGVGGAGTSVMGQAQTPALRLQPVPERAKFTHPGYFVWCGTMIKDDGCYYLFYSRWPKGSTGSAAARRNAGFRLYDDGETYDYEKGQYTWRTIRVCRQNGVWQGTLSTPEAGKPNSVGNVVWRFMTAN